ncbi:unnamed protein product [Cylicocyclus nassatus]|uniref:SCP domain-containing protein n=1 Tax=Cylicocyclus nassatus TaxID=53992 RepID=A0AA36GKA6_CYLNA|nr:unnamed protein product [Cylicocyclus nassatus]
MPTQFEHKTMARVYLVISSLTVLLPAICNALHLDPECEDGVVVGTNATAFLEFINSYRRKLVEGTQNNGKDQDPLPKAINVKDVEWDCELEEYAQLQMTKRPCGFVVDPGYPWDDVSGEHAGVYMAAYFNVSDNYDNPWENAISWHDLVEPVLQVIDNIDKAAFTIEYGRVALKNDTFDDVRKYAEWVRADVTKIACAVEYCTITPNQFTMLCITDQPPIQKGSNYTLYEAETATIATTSATTTTTIASTTIASTAATTKITTSLATTPTVPTGTPCPTAPTTPCPTAPTTPCPTYPPARAKREVKTVNVDVFVKRGKLPKAAPGENQICSNNIGMTDSLRTLFLNMHNYRRAKLALGKVISYNRKRMPPAKNIFKLSYACGLEAAALRYATYCPSTKSKANVRPLQGENFLRLAKVGFSSFADAVNMTVYDWWDIVNDTPVIDNTAKLLIRRLRSPIATFTQMAWATTRFLGCAIADCNSYYVSVCRYSPEGNVIGEMVYKPGRTCTECKRGTTCEEELGLCV